MQAVDREILRLAVPALGALAAEPLYILVDTAIVGHLGTPQLAGLGAASTVLLTGYALFVFLAYGTTGTVGRLRGAGQHERAASEGVQAMWLAGFLGAVLAVAGWALAPATIDAIGASGAAHRHAVTYLRISMAGVPALLVVLAGTGYLRGLRDTRTPLVVAVATAAGNLILEIVLVVWLDFGVAGSAWSTVIAQTAGALVYVAAVGRDVARWQVSLAPDLAALRTLAGVSADLFVRTMALRMAFTFATAVAARIGTVELAAHEVGMAVLSLLALALDSLAIAAQSLVAHELGAGRAPEAARYADRVVAWSVGTGVVFALVMLALHRVVAPLFSDDGRVESLAAFLLLIVAVLQPLNGLVFALDGVLIGAGDLRFLAQAMVGVAIVYTAAVVTVAVLGWGIGWVWACYGLLQVGRGLALAVRWRTPAWQVVGVTRSP